MMNKKILFPIFFLIALSSLAYAIDCNVYNCNSSYYNWADFSNPIYNGSNVSSGDSTLNGGWDNTYFNTPADYTDVEFNTTPLAINITSSGTFELNRSYTGSFNTSCIDFLFTDLATAGAGTEEWNLYLSGNSARQIQQAGQYCKNDISGVLCIECGANDLDFNNTVIINTWYSVCMYWDGSNTHFSLFNGSTNVEDRTESCTSFETSPFTDHFISYGTGDINGQMIFDNYREFNGSLGELGILVSDVTSIPSNPVWVYPSVNGQTNNTNITVNISHSGTDINFSLYVNDEVYFYNVSPTVIGSHFSWFTNFSDGTYVLKASVVNLTSNLWSNNITRTLVIDTQTPTITRLTNNNWKTDNSTVISSYLNNLTINISFFDETDLYQTLINITNSTGNSVYNYTNLTITGFTDNVSTVIDISGWSIGNYTIKLVATDSHTLTSIKDYDVIKGITYFRYKTNEGNDLRIESLTIPLGKKTTKLSDRYSFEFSYLFLKDTYKFRITSKNKIDYLHSSKYLAHFVIIGDSLKGNWIDFGGIAKKDIIVKKIDDYTYEVEITSNGKTSFEFNSIGGLNTVEEHYAFKIGSVIDVWVNDSYFDTGITATAVIDSQTAHTVVNTSPATLINITRETTIVTLNATNYATSDETFTLTSNYHNFTFDLTPSSTVRIYFYDEKSEALIEGETFSIYLETTGFSNNYGGITDNPYSIRNLGSGLYKLKASSSNYPERQYLGLNVSNTTTTNLNVYLINDTLGSEITFNIVDEGLNPIDDVRTIFTKIINGTRTTIAEEDSDFAGQVVVTLDSNTQYTINFSKTNYEDRTISLEPKNSEYVIKMISTIGKYNQSVYEGIRYGFEPSNTVLNNNTKYNFTFTLNSTIWDITGCNLYLWNGSILLGSDSGFTSSSCFLRIEQDTGSITNITSEATYQLDSVYNFTVSQQYRVIYTYEGQFSLKNFLDDLSDFGMAGFDDFGRMILALIVIFIITALAAQKIGFTNPEVLIFLVIAQVWLFSYVNWLYLDFAPIPTILGFDLKKYIIAILISLAGGAFVMKKFTD